MPTPEELARQQIDALLQKCGWLIQDYKKLDLSAGKGIAIREVPTSTGPCDYLLIIDRKPVGVIEAKKAGKTLSGVADQSGRYATGLPDFLRGDLEKLPFLYESTGIETYFRDERDPHPRSRRVFAFHRPETLAAWLEQPDTLRHRLAQMPFAHPYNGEGGREKLTSNRGCSRFGHAWIKTSLTIRFHNVRTIGSNGVSHLRISTAAANPFASSMSAAICTTRNHLSKWLAS